jgi:hypothetical protein
MTYNRPGVYINETLSSVPIADTSSANATGAVIAQFAQGPLTVTKINSWYDFTNLYGSYNPSYPATFGVAQYFANGGGDLYVRRVLGSGAGQASITIPSTDTTPVTMATINSLSYGSDGTNFRITFTTGSIAGKYNVTLTKEAGIADTITTGVVTAGSSDDVIVEQYYNVSFDPTSPSYIQSVINSTSRFITVVSTANPGKTPVLNTIFPFTGSGLDGSAIAATDYNTALSDFEVINQPLVLFSPELFNSFSTTSIPAAVQLNMITWASGKDVFVVLDTAANLSVSDAITYANSTNYKSSQAAVYYPYIYIQDPLSRNLRKIGPAGPIAGLFIANDKQYGPFKSPAGLRTQIKGALATERQFTNTDLDNLNTGNGGTNGSSVNAIRSIPGSGVVVMGARTLLQDGTANRYISMRRSLIYIKKNLKDIGNSALFENNDSVLWSRLRTSISVFLNQYRNQGGLVGATPADAFYVKIDAENNTPQTIASGEVHIEVGVALEYPAEFVVINLNQLVSQ